MSRRIMIGLLRALVLSTVALGLFLYSSSWAPENGLEWSTFLGGSGGTNGTAIAVDDDGNVFVAGAVDEPDFPTTPGAFDSTGSVPNDIFVVKLNPEGSALLYGTYVGGDSMDYPWDIVVNDAGEAYVSGDTWSGDFPSNDFPTTPGAFNQHQNGAEAFVSKLNPSGSALVYSTCLGGTAGEDDGLAGAVDDSGYVYLGGLALSSDFPITPDAFDSTKNGQLDAFLVKLNRQGSDLIYGTYLGGGSDDWIWDLVIDDQGFVCAAGKTYSDDFPVTPGAFDVIRNAADAFAVKMDLTSSELVYATFVGGSDSEEHCSISLDGSGNIYLAGETKSEDFPVTADAFDATFNGDVDIFIVKLNTAGGDLSYGSFLGGGDDDGTWSGGDIAADHAGMAFVTGGTWSSDFPVTAGAFDTVFISREAYITKFDLSGYPVPVILTAFQAWGGCGTITLEWATAAEVNCHSWEIHRSAGGDREYGLVGWVNGQGSADSPHSYRWVDRRVAEGVNYFYKLKQVDLDGSHRWSQTVSAAARSPVPQSYVLHQNHPNPFNATTQIVYRLPEGGHVTLKIFNPLGQEVRTLVDGQQPAGEYRVRWDGRGSDGREAASGLYLCRMKAGWFRKSMKMVLVR